MRKGEGGINYVKCAVTLVVEKVAANASVAVRNGSIVITADNTEAQVFTAAGTQVATTRVNGEAAIDVVPGIYIVKAAGKVAKVLVK